MRAIGWQCCQLVAATSPTCCRNLSQLLVAVAGLLLTSATALAVLASPALMVTLPTAVLYAPLMMAARLVWRCRTRAQVDGALDIVKRPVAGQPLLCRVK